MTATRRGLHRCQGSGDGYSGVKGSDALLAASPARSAPVIVATRLRKGSASSAPWRGRLVADSAYYNFHCREPPGGRLPVGRRKDRAVTAAIAAIPDDARTTINYPRAASDQELDSGCPTRRNPHPRLQLSRGGSHVAARLIVRRVRDANPAHSLPTNKRAVPGAAALRARSPTHPCGR